MSVRLEKILEAMENFRIDSDVALLENEGLTDLTRAQTKKVLHESFGFIKNELTKGGLLLEAQDLLKDAWTQAIMEDIQMGDYIPSMEDEGMGAGTMAAGAGLAAAGAGGAYLGPQMVNNYNQARALGQSRGASAGAAFDMAGQKINNDIANAKYAAAGVRNDLSQGASDLQRQAELAGLKAGIVGRNAVNQGVDAVKGAVNSGVDAIKGGAGLRAATVAGLRAATPDPILAKISPSKISTPATQTAQLQLPQKSTVTRVKFTK